MRSEVRGQKAEVRAAIKARWAKVRAKKAQEEAARLAKLKPSPVELQLERMGLLTPRAEFNHGRRGYHKCLRCEYTWLGRPSFKGDEGLPKRCPDCRSPLWNTPRLNKPGQGRRCQGLRHSRTW